MASTAGEHDAVREHILDAAHRVIVSHGLAAASTRAIAEEARIGVGTLYNYFDDRLELLAESMHRRARIISGPLTELPSRVGSETVADNLRRFAHEVGAILDELVPLFGAAFSDTELLEAHREAMASGHRPGGPFVADYIERYLLAERKLGRVSPEADCRAAASLVVSLCHDRAFHHYLLGRGGRPRPIAGEIDLIADAITASRPIRAGAPPPPRH